MLFDVAKARSVFLRNCKSLPAVTTLSTHSEFRVKTGRRAGTDGGVGGIHPLCFASRFTLLSILPLRAGRKVFLGGGRKKKKREDAHFRETQVVWSFGREVQFLILN